MRKPHVGQNRLDNLDWLTTRWLKDGPPLCFLQGDPGVGKTALAYELGRYVARRHQVPAVVYEVADRPAPNLTECLMELSLALRDEGRPEMAEVLFEHESPNPAYALELAMRDPVLLVVDEAQRFFRPDSGSPLPQMNGILSYLRERPNLPGRLLLVSDRVVETAPWSARIPKRPLRKLRRDEAVEMLDLRLGESGVELELPLERRQEIARGLDYNPRAIEALVGLLRLESLEAVVEAGGELWTPADQDVSPETARALERLLVERMAQQLDGRCRRDLRRWSVHRRAVGPEAVERSPELVEALTQGYLLSSHHGAIALHPVLRAMALEQLREGPAEFRQAHSAAADYHLRRGDSFAELRHHLVQAGRDDEIGAMGSRFVELVSNEVTAASAVPTDAEELDERIAVLSAVLEEGGAKGLEYHLARCLRTRGAKGDLERALAHAQRALFPGVPEAAWHLLVSLVRQTSGAEAAVAVVRRGLGELNSGDSPVPLYNLGAEMLAEDGRIDKAVALLTEGIAASPPDKNSVSLYQRCAELLGRDGRTDQAVALLRDGIALVPPEKNLYVLYQTCADLLAKDGRGAEAVELLREGARVIPPTKNLFSLYQTLCDVYCRAGEVAEAIAALREGIHRIPARSNGYKLAESALCLCAATGDDATLDAILAGEGLDAVSDEVAALGGVLRLQMRDDWAEAAIAAADARQRFPRYFTLAAVEALCLLGSGDAQAAWSALSSYPNLALRDGAPQAWLAALIHLRRWGRAEAAEALATYLGRPIEGLGELDEAYLLRLWDQQADTPDGGRLCLHYPILPASITGLEAAVGRAPFSPPRLG